MSDHIFRPSRRTAMAGLAASAFLRLNNAAHAEQASRLALRCKADVLELREGQPATPIWSLGDQPFLFKRGDRLEVATANDLPVPALLNWRGLDGAAGAEPLLARSALTPSALPLIVSESEPVQVDRDETFLIEGWRLKPDGSAIAPGLVSEGTVAVYTVNGQLTREIKVRGRERLRLRFINGLQRHVIALKIEHHDVTVMALDGQPAEPFLARGGAFALAPGGRADVFIDVALEAGSTPILMHDGEAARPIAQLVTSDEAPIRSAMLSPPATLPPNGLPSRLDLKSALRVDLPIGGDPKDWLTPATFAAAAPPAFRAKAGRAVVLSLINRAQTTSVFHLHGHHFRHLDRLDDGWKPFWLDTIAIDAGQTQRIAFAAEYPGRFLLEAVEAQWSALRRLRWYSVE
jgi:hypothetical protein